jgi:O-acetylhomoserine (thiol)-lyase
VRAGQAPDRPSGAAIVPIHMSASFVFASAEEAARRFDLREAGPIYTRIGNPTTEVLERRVAALDGGTAAVAFASGQAAVTAALSALARSGDTVVAAAELYGGTRTLLEHTLSRYGIRARFVPAEDPAAAAAAIDGTTRAVYCEVLSNPSLSIPDLRRWAAAAHAAGVPLVVDNTAATPALCRPIEHGADVVVYSATKFLGGHGAALGGVVVDGGRFDWRTSGRFPGLAGPDPAYHGLDFAERFGPAALAAKLRAQFLRDLGACLSPFNAFLLLLGIETLHLRMPRQCATAEDLARRLALHPAVAWVRHPGLPDDPSHAAARAMFDGGFGALLAFGVRGGRDAGRRFVESVGLALHLANIGDARTLVVHPASTTHRQLDPEALAAAGVPEDMVRVSLGLEDADDLWADFERGLVAAGGSP